MFWAITQRVVVIPYRHFGTTYQSHLKGVKIIWPFKMRNNPEERKSLLIRSGSLKSRLEMKIVLNRHFLLTSSAKVEDAIETYAWLALTALDCSRLHVLPNLWYTRTCQHGVLTLKIRIRFTTVFTRARHLSLFWARRIHSTPSYLFEIHFNIIPYSHMFSKYPLNLRLSD